MLNGVSFNQLYNLEQSKQSSSSSSASNSFGSLFSQTMGLNSDPVSSDLGSGLMSNSDCGSAVLMSMLKNGVTTDMVRLFFSMLGTGFSGGGLQNYVSGNYNSNSYNSFMGGFDTGTFNNDFSGTIPYAASIASNPAITSTASNRCAYLYRQVIDQFNVESNPRYEVNKKGRGDTYCNIFVWDVTRAMGAEIPHYIDPSTKEPMYYPNTQGARELTANATYDWLEEKGAQYGWREVSAEQAQLLANQGHPVVTAKKNPSGHGHVQVVCPSRDGMYDPQRGVTVAQAGSRLTDYASMTSLYRSSLPQFKYYAHV